jgi:hypothetical protein
LAAFDGFNFVHETFPEISMACDARTGDTKPTNEVTALGCAPALKIRGKVQAAHAMAAGAQ